MGITLEQSLGSAVRYILDNDVEGTKAYFENIPEELYVPSVYFPVPYIESRKVTLMSYRNTITFNVWIMAKTSWEAELRAASIRDSVLLNRLAIPVYEEDGTLSGRSIRVEEPSQRLQEEGIVVLTIPLRDYFYGYESYTLIEHFNYAWKKIKDTFGD